MLSSLRPLKILITSITIAQNSHIKVIKYSDAESQNLSRTSGSKPEVVVKYVTLLWGIVFTYWKKVTSVSMENASFESKPQKKLSEHLAQKHFFLKLQTVLRGANATWVLRVLFFFVLMNKSTDKNPVFLFQVDRWDARLPLWIPAPEIPKTDFVVLCVKNVIWHSQFFNRLDAFW